MSVPILYKEKKDCCGCGACLNICPKHAISMYEDECGYIYPKIDKKLCVECGLCKGVCNYQTSVVNNEPLKVYAAVSRDENILKISSSGGAFASLARKWIEDGGVVYGATIENDFTVHHICTDKIDKLQGSKYTQSSIGRTYEDVAFNLRAGKKVMFSGTPCQVDGLYGFLKNKPENLVTIDLVCHGVPSNKMFKDYMKSHWGMDRLDEDGKISFRDKKLGWGKNGSIINKGKKKKIWESESSYLYYFSKGWLYRENCYECKYACKHRPADITIGDYWGIEKVHPDYIGSGQWNDSKGISLICANTANGQKVIDDCEYIEEKSSNFESVSAHNGNLLHPTNRGNRNEIVLTYKENGWDAIEERFKKNIGLRFYSSRIKYKIPKKIKRLIKGLKSNG